MIGKYEMYSFIMGLKIVFLICKCLLYFLIFVLFKICKIKGKVLNICIKRLYLIVNLYLIKM